ncbi:MMPL family transporter [Natrialbaceae archaeon AArc-T1-2]|uniref:MMPL family transporter n=1 Tax=Natrialbaceae archaeon AArc-T1-2 TaxID=3053904 RepID=UPI00255AC218|nr:MMPL family transporter [Natrialbaceae archaeon AArc-T1-2]WIV67205.1 MMPL family transporter [Natrialbaceae archaeon AArc-T1-2]
MSVPERLAGTITGHSKLVLVVLLVATALVGAGATALDDDSSLEQFESDSPEVEAAEYVSENFTADDDNDTTTVQLIKRGDNVLTQESLVSSLEFQQTMRNNASINATLYEDDAVVGVENIVAISELRGEQFEELEDEQEALEDEFERLDEAGDDLEAEFEEFNETAEEIESRGDALERDAERLERDAERLEEDRTQLEADQAELDERVGVLEAALNETVELQTAYEQADSEAEREAIDQQIDDEWDDAIDAAELDAEEAATFETAGEQVREAVGADVRLEGAIQTGAAVADDPADQAVLQDALEETVELQTAYDEADSEAERAAIDDEIEETWTDAAAEADLGPQETAEFEAVGAEVRELTTEANAAPTVEDAVELGTAGVFEAEFAELEARGQELEERADELEERETDLEERSAELERDSEALEERGDDLEERADDLEERADDLEERADDLEADVEALEEADDPSLEQQIEYLESLNESEFEDAIRDALDDDDDEESGALAFMSTDYEPGTTQADARMTFVTQSTADEMDDMGGFDGDASEAQLDVRELADQQDEEYVVFGVGVISDEIDRSMGDSLAIVGPLALLFVVVALFVAYRDPLDIVLGVAGIFVVLLWTFGFMGWAGIAFNQMFVAVPVLLIGLSIDYAIHVFMRHRERRELSDITDDVGGSMLLALAGVGVALVWVTATTMIGFLANLVSPIGPVREFGVVSAVGIFSALLVFGALVPAAKVELDSLLERYGIDRRKRAFGTGDSRFGDVLSIGSTAARKAPIVVLVAVLLLTAGGVYGASQVDTSFDEEDFLAESPPAWTDHLGPLSPGEYQAKDDLEFVNENFQREDAQARILVGGDVTDPETLERIDAAESAATETEVAYTLPSGEADVRSPLSAMEDAARDNESFNETFTDADTTGDGIPDENVSTVYDEFFEVEDDAAEVIYRTDDGSYEAVQLVVAIQGDAELGDVADEMRDVAAVMDDRGLEDRWDAIATGDPIVNHVVEGDLLETVLQSLMITLVAVFAFLTLAYWLTGKGATLGAVTLLPVAVSVSWILGSMYLLEMPFNVLTGMITSLTIGLGVAYSIHVSSRYTLELERQGNAWDAIETTVQGTGGALLGSAATTVGGFGTLALAILPVLRQFGIITGLTIIYAFLASVFVLPTLLILWTRYLGPEVSFEVPEATPVASDGGSEEGEP